MASSAEYLTPCMIKVVAQHEICVGGGQFTSIAGDKRACDWHLTVNFCALIQSAGVNRELDNLDDIHYRRRPTVGGVSSAALFGVWLASDRPVPH